MEENKEKQLVKYKFGADELDLNKYLQNIKHNVQSYLDFLRLNNNWNDSLISEFKNAYNLYIQGLEDLYANGGTRFSTNEFGDITDANGVLSDVDNDGIDPSGSELYYDNEGNVISTDDYNQLKDKKKKNYNTFSANRQVAEYLRRIGSKMTPIEKEEAKKRDKFNLANHGFISYWALRNNPGGGKMNLEPWLNKDAYDETTGKRAVNNRASYLALELRNYIDLLGDYDFEGTSFPDRDTYLKSLNNVVNHLSDGVWDDSDLIALNQAGIGGDFINQFFTLEKNPNLSEEDKEKLKKEKEEENKKKKQEEWINQQLALFDSNNYQYNLDNIYNLGHLDERYWKDGEWDSKAFNESFKPGTSVDDYINNFLNNPFTAEGRKAWTSLIGSNYAKPIQGNPRLEGFYYVPQPSNKITNSALVYNPITGESFYTFIGDIPNEWKRMQNLFNLDNGYTTRSSLYSFKEGGSIPEYQLGGGFSMDEWLKLDKQRRLEENAASNTLNTAYQESRTPEELAAAERSVGTGFATEDPSLEHPETGFKGTDYLRLGSIAADVTSMVMSFVPGVGNVAAGATGAASSLATFAADWAEDGLGWDDFLNLGANLGMDALGLIPGGGVSKGAKIAKQLAKYANRIIAAVGTMHTLENGDKIIASYNKLMLEPSKLNVDDWRNISAGLGVLTGLGGAAGRKFKQARDKKLAKEKFKTSDKVAVEMIDDKGNKLMVAFDGADAKAIREAKDLPSLQKATTEKFENFKGWQLATNSHYGLQMPRKNGEWRMPIGSKEGTPRVFDLTADALGMYVNPGKWTADSRIRDVHSLQGSGANKLETVETIDKQMLDAEKALFDPLVLGLAAINNKYTARKKTLEAIKAEMDAKTALLGTNTSDFLKKKKIDTQVEALAIKDADLKNKLAARLKISKRLDAKTKDLEVVNKEITRLSEKSKSEPLTPEETQKLTDLTNEKGLLSKKISDLNIKLNNFDSHNAGWNTWESRINANEADVKGLSTIDLRILDAQALELRLKDLKGRLGRLSNWTLLVENHKIHSKAYQDLMAKALGTGDQATIELISPNARRANLNLNILEMLKKYGILYKQGGSLNLKLVRSFGDGGITNTSSTANWYLNMFNSPEMLKWLETFNKDNYQDFNNLLNSWSTNLKETGYKPGTTPLLYNLGVYDRLGLWNKTNTNPVITLLLLNGIITTKGNSGDNAEANYQDGYFGEQEFLRHGGTRESWLGREKELKTFLDKLASRGLTYTLNNDTGMYELGLIPLSNSLMSPGTNPSTAHSLGGSNQTSLEENKENGHSILNGSQLGSNFPEVNATLKYALPRSMYLNMRNNRLKDKAIASETSFLLDPIEKLRKITGSYSDLLGGLNSKAQLNNLANKSATADANTNNALNLEASVKGLDYENAGKAKDDEMKEKTSELALLQSFENLQKRHDVAMLNRLALLLTAKNKAQIEAATEARNTENNNVLFKLFELEARLKELENKAYKDSYALKDIHNDVTYNLQNYADLSEMELSVWNDVVSGKSTPSEVLSDPTKKAAYLSALQKASNAEYNLFRIYKGIPQTKWASARTMARTSEPIWNPEYAKNGSKLEIAKIKARLEDNKNFHKAHLEREKIFDKQLERVSKSLYGYIKAMIVK